MTIPSVDQSTNITNSQALIVRPSENPHLEVRRRYEELFLRTYSALHLGGKETLESRMIRKLSMSAPTHSAEEMKSRLSQYEKAHRNLKGLSQDQFASLLADATTIRIGGLGDILSLDVEGVPVIVKKICLTQEEMEHPKSTRNFFDLPSYYQYGVGSAGFGAWRELRAHEMTTQWVLNGECHNFPLMYHARVLPRPLSEQPKLTKEQRDKLVADWDGSERVGKRLAAMDAAAFECVVCMEQLSEPLASALALGKIGDLTQLEKELLLVTAFMQAKGFLHFDAHFHNLLTNGKHVYFADFGLAISQEFDLTVEERAFIDKHRDYDRMYVASELACAALIMSVKPSELEEAADQYLSEGPLYFTLDSPQADITRRYRYLARLKENFMRDLREKSKSTPYPVFLIIAELERLSFEKK
ncbi:MAG: hypothetical protein EB053_06000 [Chlamydiae bacterium]|nr:hypothetical protein [Chlamydiota bacterium]